MLTYRLKRRYGFILTYQLILHYHFILTYRLKSSYSFIIDLLFNINLSYDNNLPLHAKVPLVSRFFILQTKHEGWVLEGKS